MRLVKRAGDFEKKLGPKIEPLVPQDLNEDYQKTQTELALRKRKTMLDDEELFSMEMADLLNEQKEKNGENPLLSTWRPPASPEKENADGFVAMQFQPKPTPTPERHSDRPANVREVLQPETVSSKTVGQEAAHAQEASAPQETAYGQAAYGQAAYAQGLEEGRTAGFEEGRESGHKEGFAQGQQEGFNAGHEEGVEQGMQKGHASGFEQGQAEGFEGGYREGEAAASAAVSHKSDRYFSLIAKTVAELDGLRKDLLLAGQDIFVEIANICAEKIIRLKLKSSDDALKEVLRNAVELYADSHKFSIEMNPTDVARMRSFPDLGKVRFIENEKMESGDLKIETEKEIMSVELSRAIEQMIQDLRDKIFEPILEEQKKSS